MNMLAADDRREDYVDLVRCLAGLARMHYAQSQYGVLPRSLSLIAAPRGASVRTARARARARTCSLSGRISA